MVNLKRTIFWFLALSISNSANSTVYPNLFDISAVDPFLDSFDNGVIADSDDHDGLWSSSGNAGITYIESGSSLTIDVSTNSAHPAGRIISNLDRDFSFFRRKLKFTVSGFSLDGTANTWEKIARFSINSTQESAYNSPDSIVVQFHANGDVFVATKVNQIDKSAVNSGVLLCDQLDLDVDNVPHSFELTIDNKNLILDVFSTDNSENNQQANCSTTHNLNWWDWGEATTQGAEDGNGGFASLMFEVQRTGTSTNSSIATWGDLKIELLDEDHVSPTVYAPVVDGISLEIPELNPIDHPNLEYGILDVTAAPFNAAGDGVTDDTQAIQDAIYFARDHQLITFLPAGNYKVNDTLECEQGYYQRSNGNLEGDRNGPCSLVGSRLGARPKIILSANSLGFNLDNLENTGVVKTKSVIRFWSRFINGTVLQPEVEKPNISWNQRIENIDIDILKGNPGATGIYNRGAQGSIIRDVKVDAFDESEVDLTLAHAYAGIQGGIGSGGSIVGVEIDGGKYGLDLRKSQPAPTITDIKLYGQKDHAIIYAGREALTAVGLDVFVNAGVSTAISVSAGDDTALWLAPENGLISIIDSVIEFESYSPNNIVLKTSRPAFMQNVYLLNAGISITTTGTNSSISESVNPGSETWWRIHELAASVPNWQRTLSSTQYSYAAPIYKNGSISLFPDSYVDSFTVAPTTELLTQHQLPLQIPHWEDVDAVNVKDDYSASGDGVTDDYTALQSAINANEGKTIFLPKGYYRISQPLQLKNNTHLVGIAQHLSLILPTLSGDAYELDGSMGLKPLLITQDNASAAPYLSSFSLFIPLEMRNLQAFNWKSGEGSIFIDIGLKRDPVFGFLYGMHPVMQATGLGWSTPIDHPLVTFSGNGGGRWYNFYQELGQDHEDNYRHLLVDGTNQRLSFYQLNAESANGEANVELRTAANINIFGLKSEGNERTLWVNNSDHISVYGYGGAASAFEYTSNEYGTLAPSLIYIDDTPNILLSNMMGTAAVPLSKTGKGTVSYPDKWHFIVEKDANSNVIKTRPDPLNGLYTPIDRPVMYKRGYDEFSTEVTSIAVEDGYIKKLLSGTGGGFTNNTSPFQRAIAFGDSYEHDSNGDHKSYRGFLSFDIRSIPRAAVIQSVELQLFKAGDSNLGTAETDLGQILIDVKRGAFSNNAALEIADIEATADVSDTLPTKVDSGGYDTYTLSPAAIIGLQNALTNGDDGIQFRFKFSIATDDDNEDDLLGYYSSNASSSALHPKMRIIYKTQ